MGLDEDFQQAADDVKNLKTTPSDTDLLEIYGYYKQATVGDNTTSKPGLLDFKGKAKWEAWTSRSGLSSDEAKDAYVKKVTSLKTTIGLK